MPIYPRITQLSNPYDRVAHSVPTGVADAEAGKAGDGAPAAKAPML
jgi:hypothetical protein